MTENEKADKFINIINAELAEEGLTDIEKIEIKISAVLIIEYLNMIGFPYRTKTGRITLRLLLRAIELVELEKNENKTH